MSIFPKSQNKTKNKVPLGSAGVPTFVIKIQDKTKNKVPLWSAGVPTICHQIQDKTKTKVPLWSAGVPTICHQNKRNIFPKRQGKFKSKNKRVSSQKTMVFPWLIRLSPTNLS